MLRGMPPNRTVGWCVSFQSSNSYGHCAVSPSESNCQEGRKERSLLRLFALCLSQLTVRLSCGPNGSTILRWA